MSYHRVLTFLAAICLTQSAFAYTCDKDQIGPVSVTVEKIEKVVKFDTPYNVKITFKNESDAAMDVSISARSIERVTVDLNEQSITVPAKGTAETTLTVQCGAGTYNAHYPVHVSAEFTLDGQKQILRPVQVFETDFGAAGVTKKPVGKSTDGREIFTGEMTEHGSGLPVLVVPNIGGVALTETEAYRVTYLQDKDKNAAPTVLNVGWQGSDERSLMHFSKTPMTRGGISRKSLSIHPPYQGGPGTMFTEYLVQLPNTTPITFSSFLAIRDVAPTEPESDGVTFAVWVNDEKIGGKHCASKTWEPFQVDLSRFAGQTVLLRLQSDPGPKRDTTCDSAFWGTPLIYAGKRPQVLSSEDKARMFAENLDALKNSHFNPPTSSSKNAVMKKPTWKDNTLIFSGADFKYVITLGNNGFVDGVIGIGNAESQIQFDGLKVFLQEQPLGEWPSTLQWGECQLLPALNYPPGFERYEQEVWSGDKKWTLTFTIDTTYRSPALRLGVICDDPSAITKVEFGPATRHAERVYFGHGYCITEPERFEVTGGGHSLSTSHVGFDFDNGLSLLMATTTPPDRFIVDPAGKIYTLSVCPGTTMTLLPGTSGAMDCAIRYRPLYDKQAAPGVMNKAGRFVFDVWGGQYGDHLKKMQEQIDYGVADALFVNHNWQRWGYDNRLPDIWPPNPRFGTLDEIKQLNELCKKHGILYGLHDNYIDIYPDATGYDFDVVSFNENGQPRKAWNNYGIEAQSYQLRPDKMMPFLERNFDMMMPELPLSTYFVDVFASINLHEFWDRDGNKHGRSEMLANWCKAFDVIRERLGNNYPTISEAGSDFLIGHLDGADCQFLTLSDEPGDFKILLRCKHWARVPWFDAVNHTRFSLHGVGYDSRYAAHRGYDLHGYMSDDYMSAEVLTGHALQVGWNNIGRDSVRKYWLLQPVARNLADAEIEWVHLPYAPLDANFISPLMNVQWSNRTLIFMNLSNKDINFLDAMIIPQYGFFLSDFAADKEPTVSAGIVSVPFIEGSNGHQIIEYSSAVVGDEYRLYFNPRQVGTNALPIMPTAKTFERVGDDQFQLVVDWNVFRSLKQRNAEKQDVKDYAYFLHLEPPQMAWYERPKLTVLGGGMPETAVSQWESNQTQDFGAITVPGELETGTYNVLIGLWDANGDKQRAKLLGPGPDNSRILLGKLKLEKRDGKITKLDFVPEKEDAPELFERLLPAKKEVLEAIVAPNSVLQNYPFRSTGGVQLRYPKDAAERDSVEMTVTPLPEEPASTVVINFNTISVTSETPMPNSKFTQCESLIAVDRTGKKLRDVAFRLENDELRFDTAQGEFAYKIVVRK